ncbi:MAG: hypothetical protein KatS3mg060_3395 [Dehalococcoidia bacterium]|nr:MAG: hypothetical protein KatS3mg060_3395 [Dehalococcoidia bacterium]
MIPIRLRLRNFLSYRETEPLHFDSFQIACLCGENGHGKSTLLDAITWALWGRSRAKTDDELIHHGQTDMEVEFEFQLGEARYRVIRKRSRGKGKSVAGLELQMDAGGRFTSLSGNSIRETEQAIVDLLRLDYETFVNSSFLLQGKADSFTISPPSKRKELLAEILGLTQYDELEARARERVRTCKQAIEHIDAKIEQIDAELTNEPRYRQLLETFVLQATKLEAEVDQLDGEIEGQQQLRQHLGSAPQLIREIEEELRRADQLQQARRKRLDELTAQIESAERVRAERAEIEEGYACYQAAQQVVAEQSDKASRLHDLQAKRQQLVAAIQQAVAKLEQERSQLFGRIEQLTAAAGDVVSLDAEIAALAERVEAAQARREALATRRELLQQLVERTGQYAAEQDQLRREMKGLKERIEYLRGMSRCETCGQDLSPPVRDRQIAFLEAEGKKLGDRFRDLKRQIEELAEQRAEEQRAIAEEDAAVRAILDGEGRRLAGLRERRNAAVKAAAELERLRPRLATLDEALATRRYAEAEQAALAELDAAIAVLDFDNEALKAARERVETFRPFLERYGRLQQADEQIERWRGEAQERASELADAERAIARRKGELEEYRQRAAQLAGVEQRLQQLGSALAALRQDYLEADRQRSRYQQLVDTCDQLRAQRVEYEKERGEAARELGIYEELARAFGKGGVQALIIETVLPEIEEEANALLARMTDGRMRLALATQRETQQGKLVETLLIQISDELGLRNYELFSGGEAFRVNFALRIALAKLLARRAGARLETLVIDEGFGTQDASGRDRLIEAIRSIEGDFAKIIVVTHIDELKEAFPARIEVTKGADGSKFAVSRR